MANDTAPRRAAGPDPAEPHPDPGKTDTTDQAGGTPAAQPTAPKAKESKESKASKDTATSQPPEDGKDGVPLVNGVYGKSLRKLRDGRLGVEPFLSREEAVEAAARMGVSDSTVPFLYQYAWVLVSKSLTRYIALGRGGQPFRTATDARHVIRMNPSFGERQYDVLPYKDGFAIVPACLEMTLRLCYPAFVSFILAEGGERDVATVQANDGGHRMVFSRGQKVSAPIGVFNCLRDARGAVVDPVSDARPGQPGYRFRMMGSKFPVQSVLGAVSEREHRQAAEAGREVRRLQIEREALNALQTRPDDGFSRLDGQEDPDVTRGI